MRINFIPWRVSNFFNVHFHKLWMFTKFGTTNLNTKKHWDLRFSQDEYIYSTAISIENFILKKIREKDMKTVKNVLMVFVCLMVSLLDISGLSHAGTTELHDGIILNSETYDAIRAISGLGESYDSIDNCRATVVLFNDLYPDYTRTACFLDSNDGYFYFLVPNDKIVNVTEILSEDLFPADYDNYYVCKFGSNDLFGEYDFDRLDYCDSATDCSDAGGFWNDGMCSNQPEPELTITSIICNEPIRIGEEITVTWESSGTNPDDKMIISMRRISSEKLSEPDDKDWFRFTSHGADTSNDGSEILIIPETLTPAEDWQLCIKIEKNNSDIVACSSSLYTILDRDRYEELCASFYFWNLTLSIPCFTVDEIDDYYASLQLKMISPIGIFEVVNFEEITKPFGENENYCSTFSWSKNRLIVPCIDLGDMEKYEAVLEITSPYPLQFTVTSINSLNKGGDFCVNDLTGSLSYPLKRSEFSRWNPITGFHMYGFGSEWTIGASYIPAYDTSIEIKRLHTGVDLYEKAGGDVCAVYAGVVKAVYAADRSGKWGYCVTIEHTDSCNNKFTTNYTHLPFDSIKVKEKDSVDKNQIIGKVRKSDVADHLHFTIRKGAYSNDSNRGAWPEFRVSKEDKVMYAKYGDVVFEDSNFVDPEKVKWVFPVQE